MASVKIISLLIQCVVLTAYGYPAKVPIRKSSNLFFHQAFLTFQESFTTPEDREHGVVTTLNFTVHRLNGGSQALFTLSHRNKALRHAAGDTWGVMKKSKD